MLDCVPSSRRTKPFSIHLEHVVDVTCPFLSLPISPDLVSSKTASGCMFRYDVAIGPFPFSGSCDAYIYFLPAVSRRRVVADSTAQQC